MEQTNKEKRSYYSKQAIERIGETKLNSQGSIMWIINYNGYEDITVLFKNGYSKNTTYGSFKQGNVSNPYDKTVFNCGYLGVGKYKTIANGILTAEYKTWHGMLTRCYSEKYIKREPTYKGCNVCDEWLNFQNFAEWYINNYYKCDGYAMHLDKDILHKGNKIYSPESCVFVPACINKLFVKDDKFRGNLPIGVSIYDSKYRAQCRNRNEVKTLGYFGTVKEAFEVYKFYKEGLIQEIAMLYKNRIPIKLYNAMLDYKVEITD